MESTFKQRIVGAFVLVALAIIVIPLLLDGPEPPVRADGVSLDVPPRPDRNFQTRQIDLGAPGSVSSPVVSAPRPLGLTAPDPAGATVEQRPNGLAVVDVDPAQAPPRLDPEEDSEAATAASTRADQAARMAEPLAAAPAASGDRWVVNLATLGDAANATAFLARLKAAGIAAYAEPTVLAGKPATRVRAGPFASRARAEAARISAKSQGGAADGAIVLLDATGAGMPSPAATTDTAASARGTPAANSAAVPPAAAPATPSSAPPAAGSYVIQAGAFGDRADADVRRGQLASAGFSAWVEAVPTDQGTLYRVRLPADVDRARADVTAQSIRDKVGGEAAVVGR